MRVRVCMCVCAADDEVEWWTHCTGKAEVAKLHMEMRETWENNNGQKVANDVQIPWT